MNSFIENVNYVANLDNKYGSGIELYKNNLSLKSVQHDIELKFSYYNNDDKKIHSIVHLEPGVLVGGINDTLLSFKTLVESSITGSEFTCTVSSGVQDFVINNIVMVNISIVSNSNIYKAYELEMKVVTAGVVTYDVFGEVKDSLKVLPSLAMITASDVDAMVKAYEIREDVAAVSENIANVTTVSDSIANVNTVGISITNVNIVGEDIVNVNTVSTHISNVDTVSQSISNVNTVGSNIVDVGIASTNIASIKTVANAKNLADIIRVADDLNSLDVNGIADITIVANDLVLGVDSNIISVSESINEVVAVESNLAYVITVSNNIVNVNNVSDNIDNVNTVGNSILNVNLTGNSINDVITVASGLNNIGTVSDNILDINTVSNNIVDINAVSAGIIDISINALHINNIDTIATHIANVDTVANDINDINTISASMANIDTVSGSIASVNTVGSSITNVNTVGNNITDVAIVADNTLDIDIVSGSITSVNTVAADISNINSTISNIAHIDTVALNVLDIVATSINIDDIVTVANDITDVSTVASNIASVNTIVDNVTDITYFADKYLGEKTIEPTVRNDGSALNVADMYYYSNTANPSQNIMKTWNGTSWDVAYAGLNNYYTKAEVQTVLPAIGLDTTNTIAPTRVGQMKWNQADGTADLQLINGVTLQLGQENNRLVRASGSVANGRLCMFAGTVGNSGRVKVKHFTGLFSEHSLVYGIATQDITSGSDGYITTNGKVRWIDTTGAPYGEVWADEDVIYAKPNDNGALTNVEPGEDQLKMIVATVIHAHSNGTLEIRVLPFNENMIAKRANKLTTARDIEISGVITGSASFDGSGDINIATAIGSVDFGEI